MQNRCAECKYSIAGSYNELSDICESCRHDPDTGWGGFTDHSICDDEGNSMHFMSDAEQQSFFDDLDDDECW